MIVAFDLDGTIVDSEEAKLSAFASLFAGTSAYDAVVQYNAANRGVPRSVKFDYICRNLTRVDNIERSVALLLENYSIELEKRLKKCPPISGVCEFLRKLDVPKAVVSSAPVREIQDCLKQLAIRDCFAYIYGSTTSKKDALSELSSMTDRVVYFGDAPADRRAAHLSRCGFVRVRSNVHPELFHDYNGAEISNFDNIEEVLAAMESEVHNTDRASLGH